MQAFLLVLYVWGGEVILGGLREEAEGVVTETLSFRHVDPFNADDQDTSSIVSTRIEGTI